MCIFQKCFGTNGLGFVSDANLLRVPVSSAHSLRPDAWATRRDAEVTLYPAISASLARFGWLPAKYHCTG
jgi:hypothetical protein